MKTELSSDQEITRWLKRIEGLKRSDKDPLDENTGEHFVPSIRLAISEVFKAYALDELKTPKITGKIAKKT